jgi:hypothetical protein
MRSRTAPASWSTAAVILRAHRLQIVTCLIAAAACRSTVEVSGSIFLSGRDQTVRTLPLVQINVYTEPELRAIAARRKATAGMLTTGLQDSDTLVAAARMARVLLDSLPTAAISVRSDGEGRFPLTLSSGQRYLVMARASTTVDAFSSVIHEWFVWYTPNRSNARLMLANDNLSTSRVGLSAMVQLGRLVQAVTAGP